MSTMNAWFNLLLSFINLGQWNTICYGCLGLVLHSEEWRDSLDLNRFIYLK